VAGVYRFEDLRVWQAAKRQCDRVGELLRRPAFRSDRQMSDHMNDAALSVMFNISEGFLRRRDAETSNFLRYSFASNGELKSGNYAAQGRKYLSADEAAELIELNESIARMLRRWQATLKPAGGARNQGRGTAKKDQKRGTRGRTEDQERTKDKATKHQGPTISDEL
jgi:four helix bundle protein